MLIFSYLFVPTDARNTEDKQPTSPLFVDKPFVCHSSDTTPHSFFSTHNHLYREILRSTPQTLRKTILLCVLDHVHNFGHIIKLLHHKAPSTDRTSEYTHTYMQCILSSIGLFCIDKFIKIRIPTYLDEFSN